MSATDAKRITQALRQDPLLGKLDFISLARLLPFGELRQLQPGETLFTKGDLADTVYLVVQGRLGWGGSAEGQAGSCESGCLGEEGVIGIAHHLATIQAEIPSAVALFPAAAVSAALEGDPAIRTALHHALLERVHGLDIPRVPDAAKAGSRPVPWRELAGWALTLLCYAVPPLLRGKVPLQETQLIFLGIFLATACMWVFSLVDEYVPGVFALTATLIQGLVPPQIILGGFSSDAFLMALSILGLGAVITASGLSYRFLLLLMRWLPNNQFGYNSVLMVTGTLLTPTLPTINGRVGLMSPFLRDILDSLGFAKGQRAANRLATSAFAGVTLFSAVFLSSKSVNFVVLNLLPPQVQDSFQWLNWLFAASLSGLVSLVLYVLAVTFVFRNQESARISMDKVASQLGMLGPMRMREWAGLVGFLAFLIGVVTMSLHRIDPPWLGLTVLYFLLIFGVLRKEEFKTSIDWAFLVYLGCLVGIVNTFNHLGLDKFLASLLPNLAGLIRSQFTAFLVVLALITFLLRLVIPTPPAIVILATVFMPMASSQGVNPWVVGFAILTLGELWFFPYQCSYYLQFRNTILKEGYYDEAQFLRFNAWFNVLKVASLFASIPFWHKLGLL